MKTEVIIHLLGVIALAWLIHGTYRHLQKRTREDKEHARQVKQRATRTHAAYQRVNKRLDE
jgi:hypothetical protein